MLFSSEIDAKVFETSSKTGHNVGEYLTNTPILKDGCKKGNL